MNIAIIVTYNALKWIDKCLGSLLSSTIPIDILVIDNGSTDGTREIIKSRYTSVRLIESDENLGFGKANNIGLKIALEENYDYSFLLNQDAWVEQDTIEKITEIHKNHPEYGIMSPIHISGDGKNLDNNFTTYINGYSCPEFVSDVILNRELKEVYEINFVNAALWLISRQVLEKVGGFDPLFFMYGEDDDYINRLKYHGFKVGLCPKVKGYHDRPQKMNDTRIWSAERLFSSRIAGIKNLNIEPEPKRKIFRSLLKVITKNFFTNGKYSNQLALMREIFLVYDIIILHRAKCKQSHPTFLDE